MPDIRTFWMKTLSAVPWGIVYSYQLPSTLAAGTREHLLHHRSALTSIALQCLLCVGCKTIDFTDTRKSHNSACDCARACVCANRVRAPVFQSDHLTPPTLLPHSPSLASTTAIVPARSARLGTAFTPRRCLTAAPHPKQQEAATTTTFEESKQSRFDGRVYVCMCVCLCMYAHCLGNVVVVGGVHTYISFICISTGVIVLAQWGRRAMRGPLECTHLTFTYTHHTLVGSHCARTAGTNTHKTHTYTARCVYTEVFDDDETHTDSGGKEQQSPRDWRARRRPAQAPRRRRTWAHTIHTRGRTIARRLDWGAYRFFGRILLDFIGQIHSDVFLYGETWPPSLFDSIFVGFCGGGALMLCYCCCRAVRWEPSVLIGQMYCVVVLCVCVYVFVQSTQLSLYMCECLTAHMCIFIAVQRNTIWERKRVFDDSPDGAMINEEKYVRIIESFLQYRLYKFYYL